MPRTTLPHEQFTNLVLVGRIPELHRPPGSMDASRVPKSDQLMDALRDQIELYVSRDPDTGYRVALA